MSTLLTRVRRTLGARRLIPAGSRVVAAISGGPDSVTLAHALFAIAAEDGGFTLAGLAHFNHQLRGDAADEDERVCRSFAESLGVPIEIARADVAALARESHRSLEDAGRRARYEFLERAADGVGADRIAVGHTRDDQAETFLLKLFRGAGAAGLAGIYPERGRLVRPLFDCSRADVLEYLEAQGLSWREDETNQSVDNPRNRVRHELIPYLNTHFSGSIEGVLAREAELARLDAEFLEPQVIEAARCVVLEEEGGTRLVDTARLTALPPALAWRVARRALLAGSRSRGVEFRHVQALLALAAGDSGREIDLPGQHAELEGDRIRLTSRVLRARTDISGVNFSRYPLSIPGEVAAGDLGWTISATPAELAQPMGDPDGRLATVEAEALEAPLAVRTRRAGDAFRPLGLGGRKKLQDFFVDRKIARAERDNVPLVVDARDRIVWVVGHTIADDFRVTGRTGAVIVLKARRSGGSG